MHPSHSRACRVDDARIGATFSTTPEAPWPALQRLEEKSAEAGFQLRARLPVYPEFIVQADKFLSSSMRSHVERLCDADGYVKHGGPLRFLASLQYSNTPIL